jgi:starch phosphorylase
LNHAYGIESSKKCIKSEAISMSSEPDDSTACHLLSNKLKHYLITTIGKTVDEASAKDIFNALSLALREEMMMHWLATWRSYRQVKAKTVYYLSLEFLPGRLTENTFINLKAHALVNRVLEKIGRGDCKDHFYERDPALGNGGLGRLASCIIESLATAGYPAMAYGLRYQYGLFEQELWQGKQIERPDWWLEDTNPWEFRRDTRGQTVNYFGRFQLEKNSLGDDIATVQNPQTVRATAFDIPIVGYRDNNNFNVNTLRLWSTRESPRNFELQRFNAGEMDGAAENITLTDVLYPTDNHEGGRRLRLKQEYLLVSASLKDIIRRHKSLYKSCDNLAEKVAIQINDTHPALAVAELMHQLTTHEKMPWNQAFEITRATISYTNHTILKEALEEWPQIHLQAMLPRQYYIIERLNFDFCQSVRERFSGDEERVRRLSILQDGKVKMAHLAFVGSHHVNGVADLHVKILKERVFKDFHDMWPDKILSITNGVTPRKWILTVNPALSQFLTKRLGINWVKDLTIIKGLESYVDDELSIKELQSIKRDNKQALIDYINQSVAHDDKGISYPLKLELNTDMIFDVQIKRIHEYKRQLLNILYVIELYLEMIKDPSSRSARFVIFAGKAAASYEMAKKIIRLICVVARVVNQDPRIKGRLKIHFFENYNVSLAQRIIPAADLSEQISTAGMEASGTGNMKLALNGALTIGTEDGANVQMRQAVTDSAWPFEFGAHADEIERLRQSDYRPETLYYADPTLKRVLDTLTDGTFASNDDEAKDLEEIFRHLVGAGWSKADPYFVLYDYTSYSLTQRKVDILYQQPNKWTQLCLLNIARMSSFSIDRCVNEYAQKVWNIQPHPIDEQTLNRAFKDFEEHSTVITSYDKV